jgi:hypothetical protein
MAMVETARLEPTAAPSVSDAFGTDLVAYQNIVLIELWGTDRGAQPLSIAMS